MSVQKLIILSISFAIVIFSCTPQIRYASSNNINKASKKIVKKSKSKDSRTISKAFKNINTTANNLKDEFTETINLDFERVNLISQAKDMLGTPYCWGGEDSECTDCSGFVLQIFQNLGINLPRTAAKQYQFGDEIRDEDILPGDLVFFVRKNKIGHVGIYIGNNHFIHASSSKGVIITDLDNKYYRTTYAGARRILRNV